MSQNRNQNLVTTQRAPNQGLQQARPMTGKLTRLEDHRETDQLSTINPEQAALWLEEAHTKGHVVSPASSMPIFPHGRGVQVSIVRVTDFNPQGTQLYPIPGSGNLGLHKNVLDDIGRGYGIDWPKEWSVDVPFSRPGQPPDPRDADPWVVQWQVCGRIRKFDGGWMTLPAMTKEVDLREGSAEVEQIRTRQQDKALKDNSGYMQGWTREQRIEEGVRRANAELAQVRKFIKSHAQTKARLMVIGTLVRRSYSKEELQFPFYVFQGIWVGRSENPEIDKMFAEGAMKMEQEARGMLFGQTTEPVPQLPPVSDQPYQEDADMIAYEEAMRQATTGTPPPIDPPATATAVSPDAPRQCTPDECFGKGSAHVKACYQQMPNSAPPATAVPSPQTESDAPQVDPPWIIADGKLTGIPINDPRVTDSDLGSLIDLYTSWLERDDLAEDAVGRIKRKLGHVQAEVSRRGLVG